MPRQLPPLNALRAFEAAGRHTSFTGAAQELKVSHAAISRHVRGLEQRLGVQLFRNVARGVELTDAGAEYLRVISPALEQISTATESLSKDRGGRVTISVEPTFAAKWLMANLGAFQDANPEIEISIDATPRLADIRRYECDLAIRFCSGGESDLKWDLLSRSPVYPYAAPSFDAPAEPADLLRTRLLQDDDGRLWRRWFAAAGLPDAALPKAAGRFASLLMIEAALAGRGVALASEELVGDDLRNSRLKRLFDIGLEHGGYYLMYLPETARRKPVRVFRAWLLEATGPLRRKGVAG